MVASVWERTAAGVLPLLDDGLADYFGVLPAGQIGRGNGVFRQVGTPRRWLWPVLWLLGREGIIFPVWQQDVPFEVVNRPSVDEQGRVSLSAQRSFEFRRGIRVMVDAITAEHDGSLTDYLGKHGWLAASLLAEAQGGAMHLRSTKIRFRWPWPWPWPWGWCTVPKVIAPRVQIYERVEVKTGRQHITMRLSQPQLGLLYEYDGEFDYRLEGPF